MVYRAHPSFLNLDTAIAHGYIFCDRLKVHTCLGRAFGEVGFADISVRQIRFLGEASGVHLRRSCQAVAPFERQEAMVHPSLIRKFKNLLCIGVRFGAEERRRDEHPERDCNGFPFSSHWAPSSKFEIIDA